MATVSVITPTYNRARFLPAAVASVLSQTFGDFELIIVDDGSEDNTPDVLKPFLADRRVRYVYQENKGQSHARNLALKQATGDFIAFLDSDDVWARDKLEKQLAVFRANSEVDIVHGDEATINEQGSVVSLQNMRRYSGRITRYLLADNSVSITTALVRRRCFDEMGGFDTSVGVADDYELWLRFSAKYRFQYIPEIVAAYRIMENQISSNKIKRFETNEVIIDRFLKQYGNVITPRERRIGVSKFYCRKARYYAGIKQRRIAAGALLRAFSLAPIDQAVWRALYRVIIK
jgi:glycosyltransferase involved in cell wall biosynthesis